MKKTLFLFAIMLSAASVTFAQGPRISIDVIIGSKPPAPNEVNLMNKEEAKHPNIAKSMHDIEDAIKHLNEAPDDFGGHKAQALTDLKQSWISLRKALYFRIYQDRR